MAGVSPGAVMPQIAVVSRSKNIDPSWLAFAVAACSKQVEECAAAWGIPPVPVVLYKTSDHLPAVECRLMLIVDDLGEAGMLGFHDDELGVIYGQVLAQSDATSVTLSHECLEELVDPTCDKWTMLPDGRRSTAREVCDAVEADTYVEPVTIMGETRNIRLSNYLLPSWFQPGGSAPFDRMGKLESGMPDCTPGGYLIIKDDLGNISSVFASKVPERMGAKLGNPVSRTLRRFGNEGASTT